MSTVCECPGREEYGRCIESAALALSDLDAFKGSSVLITGATGMIGGALARTFLYINRVQGLGIKLLLPIRRESRDEALFGIAGRDEAVFIRHSANEQFDIDGDIDYIVHAASPTKSAELAGASADALSQSVLYTLNVMELAKVKRPRGLVYLSSMEAYGVMDGEADEDRLGYLDLTSPRSCYPVSKRLGENACACYAKQYGVNACSARLAQVIGAGIKKGESRAYAAFAKAALDAKPIALKTLGASMGNYVHISDAISAVFTLLTKGAKGEIYNVCGDNCRITIKELAELISETLSGGKSEIVREPSAGANPYAPDTGITLTNKKLKALGWNSEYGLTDMIASLGKDIAESGL